MRWMVLASLILQLSPLAQAKSRAPNGCERATDPLDIAICTAELEKESDSDALDLTRQKAKAPPVKRTPANVLGRGASDFGDYLATNARHPALSTTATRQTAFAEAAPQATLKIPVDPKAERTPAGD